MTVMQDLSFEVALKGLGEENQVISPAALAGLLSTLLYARRSSPFFVEPIVAGLDARGQPYLCGQVNGGGKYIICSQIFITMFLPFMAGRARRPGPGRGMYSCVLMMMHAVMIAVDRN